MMNTTTTATIETETFFPVNSFNDCPVNSFNEWDPLEEVIVGIVDGASFPSWHIAMEAVLPSDQVENFRQNAGKPFPAELIGAADKELEEFVHILEGEGVKVRRPDPLDQLQSYNGLGWTSCNPTTAWVGPAPDSIPRCRATCCW